MASFDVHYVASVSNRDVCEATLTYVSVDRSSAKSLPIPETVRAGLEVSAGGSLDGES